MKLYHAGTAEIRRPDLKIGRKNADFGQGFYLSPDIAFTRRWASRGAVINEYELDLSGLVIQRFERTEAWFQYIFDNRRARDALDSDVIIGPIANDTIFETFGVITSGFLTPRQALKLLSVGPEYTQVALKTERAINHLRWLSAAACTGAKEDAAESEKRDYQTALEKTLAEILED